MAEYIQLSGGKAPGTPAALNTAGFLRVRPAADGARPGPANAVIVGLPGFSSTPPHWLYLASQMVSRASKESCGGQACRVEVWVLQRRGANLAETQALTEARRKGDPALALNHYLGADSLGPTGQGGGFVSNSAARKRPDGRRGVEGLAGLIFLDGGPSARVQTEPTPAELDAYFARVEALRSGKDRVYTDARGPLGAIAGPASAASQSVTGVYYALSDPTAEAILPLRVAGMAAAPGADFLKSVRLT
jgi:hypothetical protein